VREEAQRPFDLTKGPLLRVTVVRLGGEDQLLLIMMHHIVSDGWSMWVIVRELAALYGAYRGGRDSPLEELPIQYADYALWQREWLQGEVLQGQLQYWRKQLAGAPAALQLPTDHPRPAVASYRGASVDFELGEDLSRALARLSRESGCTLYMVLLAAFQVLLSRWSGQEDIVVGSPIAGRTHRELEGLVGLFLNALPLRTRLTGNPSFLELLGRVREMTLEAYAHQELPFEKLVAELQPQRDLARQSIFQVDFSFQNIRPEDIRFPNLQLGRVEPKHGSAKLDLSLYMFDTASGLRGRFEYATDLFHRRTIENLAGRFRSILDGITK